MIADAVDTAVTLGWALAGWIVALAALCTIGLLGTVGLAVWAWTACTRALRRPLWARGWLRAERFVWATRRQQTAATAPQTQSSPSPSDGEGPGRALDARLPRCGMGSVPGVIGAPISPEAGAQAVPRLGGGGTTQ